MQSNSLKCIFSFGFSLFLFGGLSFASEEPKVDITSFKFAGSRTRVAELCGKVLNVDADWILVQVTVDPKSKTPGLYYVPAGKDGKFCTTVVTYTGQALAAVGDNTGAGVVSEVNPGSRDN